MVAATTLSTAAVIVGWIGAAAGGVVALRFMRRRLSAPSRGPFEEVVRSWRMPEAPPRPADLERMELLVADESIRADQVHFRLRPIVQDVAAWAGLSTTTSSPTESQPARLLDDLCRPERPKPEDPYRPELQRSQLEALVAYLEERIRT